MSVLDRPAPSSGGEETGPETTGLSRNAAGRRVPLAALRVLGRLEALGDRWWGWIGPVLITALTFALRVRDLGNPHEFSFDETYYAKDAWSMLNNGFVQNYQQTVDGMKIDDAILSGHTTGIWTDGPAMIVHPEVGKWLIALGEKAFGMDPFGWRIAACVVGSLMVLVMCRLARRVTGSTLLGCVAGLLMCFDGLEFVLSRLALLDIFLAFFVLCGTACVVNDRDWHRRRLGQLIGTDPAAVDAAGRGWGPVRSMLWRPWLLAGGVCFGLGCGTKWDAVYPMAAFGVLVWLWSSNARRSFGVRWSVAKGALVDGVPAFLQLVLVAVVVYIASWTGWMMHYGQYEAHLSATQYTQFTGTLRDAANNYTGCAGGEKGGDYQTLPPDTSKHWPTRDEAPSTGIGQWERALKDLWYYHHDVYVFHTNFLNCSTHPYGSKPSGWPLINRPVGVATDLTIQPGQDGCTAAAGSTCYRETLLIGTPVLWWGGFLALIFAAVMWVATRDWRFGVALTGALATWLPWLMYDDRPIFFFYAIAYLPFMVLAIVLAMGKLIGRSSEPSTRRTVGVIVSGSFFVLVLLNFAYFFPILSYELIPRSSWLHRMWFARWI